MLSSKRMGSRFSFTSPYPPCILLQAIRGLPPPFELQLKLFPERASGLRTLQPVDKMVVLLIFSSVDQRCFSVGGLLADYTSGSFGLSTSLTSQYGP